MCGGIGKPDKHVSHEFDITQFDEQEMFFEYLTTDSHTFLKGGGSVLVKPVTKQSCTLTWLGEYRHDTGDAPTEAQGDAFPFYLCTFFYRDGPERPKSWEDVCVAEGHRLELQWLLAGNPLQRRTSLSRYFALTGNCRTSSCRPRLVTVGTMFSRSSSEFCGEYGRLSLTCTRRCEGGAPCRAPHVRVPAGVPDRRSACPRRSSRRRDAMPGEWRNASCRL